MPTMFNCKTCGAALVWRPDPVIECEYCHAKVVMSPALVPRPRPPGTAGGSRRGALVIGGVILTMCVINVVRSQISKAAVTVQTSSVSSTTSSTNVEIRVQANAAAPAQPASIAKKILEVGSAGTGAGQLTGARALAVTPAGDIVVAESSTGRVQVFDAKGAYQRLITVPPSALTKAVTIYGAGANDTGQVIVSRAGDLVVLDVAGGKVARTIRGSYPDVYYVGDVDVVPDGSMYAVTDRTGDLSVLHVSPAGKVIGRLANIGARHVAADGLGTTLVTDDDAVAVRDGKGAIARRFSQGNPSRGKLSRPGAIALDGRGHVFVEEGSRVVIFDLEGKFLGELEVGSLQDLAIDRAGFLYVLGSDKVTKYELAIPG